MVNYEMALGKFISPRTIYSHPCSQKPIHQVIASAGRFLGFPTWYRGLTDAPPDCNIKTHSDSGGLGNFIWHIGLNIVEIILVAIAYIATAYFLYGGLLFIVSRGNPDGATRARSTILNAIIGLIISMASIALVNFVVGSILK